MWLLDVKCPHYLAKTSVKLCTEDSPHAEDSDKSAHKKHTGAWIWLLQSLCIFYSWWRWIFYQTLCEMESAWFEDPAVYIIEHISTSCVFCFFFFSGQVITYVADCIPPSGLVWTAWVALFCWFRTGFPQRMAHHNSSEICTNRYYLSKHLKMSQIFSWYHKRLINYVWSLFPDIHREVTRSLKLNVISLHMVF